VELLVYVACRARGCGPLPSLYSDTTAHEDERVRRRDARETRLCHLRNRSGALLNSTRVSYSKTIHVPTNQSSNNTFARTSSLSGTNAIASRIAIIFR